MKMSHMTKLSGVVSTFFGSYTVNTLGSVKKEPQKLFEGLATRTIWLQNIFSFYRH